MQKFRCTDIVEKNVIQNLLREKLNQKKRIIHFVFLSFFIIQMKPLLREHPTYRLILDDKDGTRAGKEIGGMRAY